MGGKSILLLIIGFGTIFLLFGYNFGLFQRDSVDNMVMYYEETASHNIDVSGINLAMNELFLDKTWRDGFDELPYSNGEIDVEVDSIGSSLIKITSVGSFLNAEDTIIVKLQPSSYAKFAWYVGNMSSKEFVNGDTVWGPFHTQSELNIGGDPVFMGKVTTLKGLSPNAKQLAKNGYDPKFYGGFETGVDIPLPVNYQFTEEKNAALDGVNNKGGSSYFANTDVWLKFNADGTVTYRTGSGSDTSTYNPPVTESISSFAPNGVIYNEKGNVYMSGTVKGKVTVVSGEASGTGHGNVYLENDVVYTSDPMTWDSQKQKYVPNNSCSDMLGILATNNVRIMNNDANNKDKDIRIDASIFCAQGGMEMDDDTMPASGTVYLRGGMIAAKEEYLSKTDGSGNVTNGYKKHVIFDQRFMLALPPTFPNTGKLEIVTWYE